MYIKSRLPHHQMQVPISRLLLFWSCDCRTNRLIRCTFFNWTSVVTCVVTISIQNLNSEKNGFGNTTPMCFEAIGYWPILSKHLNGICPMTKKLSCDDALLRNRLEPRKMKRSELQQQKKKEKQRSDKLIKDDPLDQIRFLLDQKQTSKKRKTCSSIDLNGQTQT